MQTIFFVYLFIILIFSILCIYLDAEPKFELDTIEPWEWLFISIAVLIAWPGIIFQFVKFKIWPKPEPLPVPRVPLNIPTDWLNKKISIIEAEQENTFEGYIGTGAVPFGNDNTAWSEMKNIMTPRDEVWTFSSPPEAWSNLCGRGGVCNVRDGIVLDGFITIMN